MVITLMDRKEAIKKYEVAKKKGEVDEDIVSLLDKINSSPHYYTTSSCSGRIILIQLPEMGDKLNSKIIGKWHRTVNFEEVMEKLERYDRDYLFLLVQSSIIHVVCEDWGYASKLLNLARDCGFKYSTIKTVKNGKMLVEILGSENLHIPLGENGQIKIGKEELKFFVEISNHTLERIKGKLRLFENKISSLLSCA